MYPVLYNPFSELNDDLSITISVIAQQNDVLNKLGLPPKAVFFQNKVVLSVGSLNQIRIYLQCTETTKEGDSGWHVGAVSDDHEEIKYEAIYVYELVKSRSELLQVLTLPSGYMVVFDGKEIEAVVNENQENIWIS